MWEYGYSAELYHHGILGMKWGKRNGPPYPLGQENRTAMERRLNPKAKSAGDSLASKRKSVPKRKEKTLDNRIKSISKEDLIRYRHEMAERYEAGSASHSFYENASDEDLRGDIEYKRNLRKLAIAVAAGAGIGVGLYFAYKYGAIQKVTAGASPAVALKDALADIQQVTAPSDDIVFPKGMEFHRMVAKAGIDFSTMTSPTYVSYKDQDILTYMSRLKDWTGSGKRYGVVLKSTKDIRMPSEATARKIVEGLFVKDPSYQAALRYTLLDTYMDLYEKAGLNVADPSIAAQITQLVSTDIRKDPFKQSIYSIVRKGSDSKILIDEFRKRGYDAIEDYFDKGTFTNSPVILFDPSDSVVKVTESIVTDLDKQGALSALAKGTPAAIKAEADRWRKVLASVAGGTP